MNALIWFAVILFIAWLVLKFAFALTGFIFHLFWIVAVVLFIIWLIGKIF